MLNKEARKWSAKVIRDMRTVRSTTKQIIALTEQIKAAKVLPDSMFVSFPYWKHLKCLAFFTGTPLRATERYLSYGFTPVDTDECTTPYTDRLVLDLLIREGWKAELTLVVGYIPRWFTCPQTVTHPSASNASRSQTDELLIIRLTSYCYAIKPLICWYLNVHSIIIILFIYCWH